MIRILNYLGGVGLQIGTHPQRAGETEERQPAPGGRLNKQGNVLTRLVPQDKYTSMPATNS